ncbi:DUF4134 domain-containing protein [Rhodocytophaga aerolata]|uniref:DUF4134 domain-containing protein n=1 Tax=Rhodocytophaga aerolata TaxID=455078 RepID=A0ABT8RF66_9BACT|nr:DUF4134 domain-containing protein [Rhodocytophaga aerolata]MDO1450742.1 DUF4134 domain-containing protein [Rhodocytophaga aerolata]
MKSNFFFNLRAKNIASNLSNYGICLMTSLAAILITSPLFAQASKGVAALNDARQSLNQYYEAGVNVAYGAAALIGLIGGVKAYQKWTAGDPDTGKVAGAWLGGAVFLAGVTTFIRVVFIQ